MHTTRKRNSLFVKTVSILFKIILSAIIIFALYLETFSDGEIVRGAFYYFTIQSNILVAICLLLFVFMGTDSRCKCIIRGIALLAITLTGIIYNFVLYKIFIDWGTVGYTFSRTVTHLVAPLGFILDWILFDKHNMMKWKDIFIWLVYPIIYSLVSLYANFKYGFSIYFFLDMSNGCTNTLKWLGILLCTLLGIGFLFIIADSKRWRRR